MGPDGRVLPDTWCCETENLKLHFAHFFVKKVTKVIFPTK